MLDDMTTDALINSLRVLISIRGNDRQLGSDHGTNFTGANYKKKSGKLTLNWCVFFSHTESEKETPPPTPQR